MISLEGCSIRLDNPEKKYMPGQIMTGTILIEFKEPETMRGIKIGFTGASQVAFDEREHYRAGRNNYNRIVRCTAGEQFFHQESYLFGNEYQQSCTVPVGQHTYPFNYTIPHNSPSSFEGKYGHIRYTLTVTLDRPGKTMKSAFILFEVIPLSIFIDPSINRTQIIEAEKKFGCLGCASQPLKVNVQIPNDTFSPGKKIPFHIDYENGSNVEVRNIVIKLNQIETYRSLFPFSASKTQNIAICHKNCGAVPANSSRTIIDELEIPCIKIFEVNPSQIIHLFYELRFEFEVALYSNLVRSMFVKLVNINTDNQYLSPPPSYDQIQSSPQLHPHPTEKSNLNRRFPNVQPHHTHQSFIHPSAPPQ